MAAVASTLAVRITAKTRGLQKGLRKAQRSVSRASRKMRRAGKAMTAAITAPIALVGGAGVKAFADFEEAMTEVQKVTSRSTMENLVGPIKELSNDLPQTSTELATLAADAGRFGVTGTENILAFTESVSKMATATDVGVDEAGEAFAKLATVTDTPIPKVENLGSSINALSNEMATSSSEIVQAMLKSSASLSTLGASQTEIAALNAAMNEVSASSERAGTRLGRLGQEMQTPKKAKDMAKAMNMSVEAFKQMRSEAPVDLIKRMAKQMGAGGEAAGRLRSAVGAAGQKVLAGLAKNLEGVNKALGTSEEQFQKNTSLQREFDAAMRTITQQAQKLWGQIKNLAISIGARLAPALRRLVDGVRTLVQGWQSLSSETKSLVVGLGAIAAAIGPVVWGLGAIGTAAVSAWAAITSPVTLVIAAIASVGAAAGLIIDNWQHIKSFFGTMWSGVVDITKSAAEEIRQRLLLLGLHVENAFLTTWDAVKTTFRKGIQGIVDLINRGLRAIGQETLDADLTVDEDQWGIPSEQFDKKRRKVETATKNLNDAITSATETTVAEGKNLWAEFADSVRKTVSKTKNAIAGIFTPGGIGGGGGGEEGKSKVKGAFSGGQMSPMAFGMQMAEEALRATKGAADAARFSMRDLGTAGLIATRTLQRSVSALFSAFTRFGNEIVSVKERFKDFGRSMLQILSRVVTRLASAAATAAALKGIATAFSGGAIGGVSTFGGFFKGLLGLQHGGLVMGPTLAAVGEGPRTGPSNPEVVAPLSKLEGMIGKAAGGGGGGFSGPLRARIEGGMDELIFLIDQRRQHNAD